MKLYCYASNSIRHLLLSDMTHLPRLSVLEETHGTLQWQPDNFEHFCSPWTPIFREPYSTPIFCHRCLFYFHTLSSFLMLFPCFWEKHVRQPGENPAENVTEKEAKAQHWASNSYNIMRFSLFANRCYITEHEYSSIHSSPCPSARQSALTVIRHRLYCSDADIDPECISYCHLNTFHNLSCFNPSSIYTRLPSFPSPEHSVMYFLPLYSRIAYETNMYLYEMEALCCIQPFLVLCFLHTSLTCEKLQAFSLRALLCLCIDTFFIPSPPSWSFLEQQISLEWESPLLFRFFFC